MITDLVAKEIQQLKTQLEQCDSTIEEHQARKVILAAKLRALASLYESPAPPSAGPAPPPVESPAEPAPAQ